MIYLYQVLDRQNEFMQLDIRTVFTLEGDLKGLLGCWKWFGQGVGFTL